ncbi:alginate export family protein [Robertkochia solimangrovi]|uniref:alginate export family protein n=1 Tax=Robertkochia solimangrovi TaxID=2213046 RepID=UPI00117E5425|nr:alginate export family protein [Robertkochia solimangrovi]TRZ42290.1 hypothetical protein DMZ48_14775 [Robertkochia solimangrovi]
MKTSIRKLIVLFITLSTPLLHAQEFKASLDFRDRFEYRHGFGNLFPDDADPAAFVRQRARINLGYTSDRIEAMFSIQDISTWGDTRQILPADDNNSLMLFQAWVALKLNTSWKIKVGRQPISYDNQRILGGLDWAMQGRTHDAALLQYKGERWGTDLAFAFSQSGEPITGNSYDITGFFSYKTMQYAYLYKDWNGSRFSFLFMNNGFQSYNADQEADGTYNRQTTGAYFKFPAGKFNFEGNFYYQFGKANANSDLSAYDFILEAIYKPGKTAFGIGLEILSGTDQDGDSKNHSFFPLYGTNHKFNGFMDYFYVGNHANNVGLNDINAKVNVKTGDNSSLLIKGHYFAANGKLTNDADPYLGTEIDIVYSNKFWNVATVNAGYSQMFASEGMSLIKGDLPHDNLNNWFWIQLIVDPVLFTHKFNGTD